MRGLLVLVAACFSSQTPATPAPDPAAETPSQESADSSVVRNISDCPTDSTQPKRIWAPIREYPAEAIKGRVSGVVVLDIVVTPSGNVRDVKARKTGVDMRLVSAAKEHVSQWRYCPLFKDGVPVEAHVTVRINYDLRQRPR
jgi:TonB family protein